MLFYKFGPLNDQIITNSKKMMINLKINMKINLEWCIH